MAKTTDFTPRLQKRIQNLSRAINKIDAELMNKAMSVEYTIENVKTGINDITYTRDGVTQRVRYDEIESLSTKEQASLLSKLSAERYELRQERALEQLKEKGKISTQFKKSIATENKKLLENILELEDKLAGSRPEAIAAEFQDLDIKVGESWFEEADSFFQSGMGTPQLFDFYRPGEAGGFTELNSFTWNAFKVLKGLM